ncbi:peptidoglycan binding protein CsiV [Vibrio vulnificus]|uniref:peptidoglycan binding protein CsiV n=1 Tax=Vibrio vulnificus TaxID=672 RepID=UPI001EEA3F7D|nr:peptidoglycan binding protein CsiV [Vibrio vulnificus]MCG6278490.1 peptidoglycan binding protein CsiV [Vibrio vulnificus]
MRFLIPLLLLCVSMPSWAQRQFDVEVIIFKRAVDAEQTNESWPNQLPEITMTYAGDFQDAQFRQSKGVSMLPYSSYQLLSQKEALEKHAGFQVLLHKAWRQGDRGKGSAPIFRIRAGKDYSKEYNPDGSEKQAAVQAPLDGITEVSIDNPLYELDGTLQVYVQHYLFIETALDLKEPSVREITLEATPLEENAEQLGQVDGNVQLGNLTEVTPTVTVEQFLKSYRMDQKRRMRSGETHYLDHPLLGMVIQVRRVQ